MNNYQLEATFATQRQVDKSRELVETHGTISEVTLVYCRMGACYKIRFRDGVTLPISPEGMVLADAELDDEF